MALTVYYSPSAQSRLAAIRDRLGALPRGEQAVVVGASRAAADEIVAAVAVEKGGLFGVSRVGYAELATRLALPALAKKGLSPTGALGAKAIAARAAFTTKAAGQLTYFTPVADLPGFPRALARTLRELRMAGVDMDDVTAIDSVGGNLAQLLKAADEERRTPERSIAQRCSRPPLKR